MIQARSDCDACSSWPIVGIATFKLATPPMITTTARHIVATISVARTGDVSGSTTTS